jgi:hypothetical protein
MSNQFIASMNAERLRCSALPEPTGIHSPPHAAPALLHAERPVVAGVRVAELLKLACHQAVFAIAIAIALGSVDAGAVAPAQLL